MSGRRPLGVATLVSFAIVVALVLGFTLRQAVDSGLRYFGAPAHQGRLGEYLRIGAALLPARIAATTQIVDATEGAQRDAMMAALHGPGFYLNLRDVPTASIANQASPAAETVRQEVEALLTPSRPVVAGFDLSDRARKTAEAHGPGKAVMLIQVGLMDGHWLLFTIIVDDPPLTDHVAAKFSRVSLILWLAVSLMLVLLLSFLVVRQINSPLSALVAAVEQMGGTGDAPPLVSNGPRELRAVVDAFNVMQTRLRRFVIDRTQMLAAMSHDLRTPITRLRLRLESVEGEEDREKMLTEVAKMSAMIESTLAFARDDTKQEPRTLVDMSALVEGICEDAADTGAAVTFSGEQGVTLLCRPTPIRRAISNLVDNAITYGKSALAALSREPGRVVVAIEDEGPGIPRHQRDKVFEPFYRLDSSRNQETGGVGLGLSVARSIAREHGGDIVLANRKGGGLIAKLELPG